MSAIEDEKHPSPDSAGSSMTHGHLKKDKLCLVCGDKALGYNFNAISCESCKAFFRRNAHKTIRGRCEGKCDVNVESRSFCKRCRLAKCFTVGMRKDMILNDEQKKVRKQKIIINKLRRHGSLPPEDTYSVSESEIRSAYRQKILSQSAESLKLQFPGLTDDEIKTLSKIKSEDCSDSGSCVGFTDSQKIPQSWEESAGALEDLLVNMHEADRLVLLEMNNAHESSSFLSNTQTKLKHLPTNPTEVFNVADGFVRRIIKVAKHLEFFRSVDKEDQIAMLKGSIVEIMMLRSAVNFNVKTETWTLNTSSCIKKDPNSSGTSSEANSPDPVPPQGPADYSMPKAGGFPKAGGMDIEALRKMARGGMDLSKVIPGLPPNMGIDQLRELGAKFGFCPPPSDENMDPAPSSSTGSTISAEVLKMGNNETRTMFLTYSKFIKSLMCTIFGDLIVLKFLIMMSLFSPDRQGVEDRKSIEKYQEVYANVLQKYIAIKFPEEKNMFAKCIMKLTDLRNINEVHTKMLLKMQLDNIEPLLIEIFDLSS